jgi:hypothetical protein
MIEDDGRVASAYLLESDGQIWGDVSASPETLILETPLFWPRQGAIEAGNQEEAHCERFPSTSVAVAR